MKNFIFGFICGGAIVGVSTYFITKKREETKAQLHIEKMRKEYKEKYSPKAVAIKKDDPSEIVKEYEKETTRYSDRGEAIKTSPKENNVDPAELEVPSEDAPDEYYEDSEEAAIKKEALEAHEYDKKHRNKGCRLISEDDFGQAPGFDRKEISYYVDDDTYVHDESDEVIDDPAMVFGGVIKSTRWDSDDEQTDDICIRNFALGTDYKISKNFCAYEIGN